jgi:hypothetical protein
MKNVNSRETDYEIEKDERQRNGPKMICAHEFVAQKDENFDFRSKWKRIVIILF